MKCDACKKEMQEPYYKNIFSGKFCKICYAAGIIFANAIYVKKETERLSINSAEENFERIWKLFKKSENEIEKLNKKETAQFFYFKGIYDVAIRLKLFNEIPENKDLKRRVSIFMKKKK